MNLTFISEETLSDLRTNYEDYKIHYYNKNDEWFDDYFNKAGRILESNIPFEVPKFNLDKEYAISDRKNVKIMYEALKDLTVSQATQERLWSGLAHLQLRDFTYYRLHNELVEKKDVRINTALFFKNGNKRSLFVHVLARLWWAGYMTYDEENIENPYWLTDFFTEKDFSARCVIFFSSNFTSNRAITKGILKTLWKWQQAGVNIKREHFTQSTKYLNVVGGAMMLDVLSTEEVEKMLEKHLEKVFGRERLVSNVLV